MVARSPLSPELWQLIPSDLCFKLAELDLTDKVREGSQEKEPKKDQRHAINAHRIPLDDVGAKQESGDQHQEDLR
jgi:hypothetical protein